MVSTVPGSSQHWRTTRYTTPACQRVSLKEQIFWKIRAASINTFSQPHCQFDIAFLYGLVAQKNAHLPSYAARSHPITINCRSCGGTYAFIRIRTAFVQNAKWSVGYFFVEYTFLSDRWCFDECRSTLEFQPSSWQLPIQILNSLIVGWNEQTLVME